MVIITNTMQKAQDLLATLLHHLSKSPSRWYTINGNTTTKISLTQRLGFFDELDYYAFLVTAGLSGYDYKKNTTTKELKIHKDAWVDKILHNDAIANDNIELAKFHFDTDSAIDGLKQQTKDKTHHHVIRIGVKNAGWHSNVTKMLKDGINTLPPLENLSSKQRNFACSINQMTLDTIINNPDLYNHAMREAAANKEKAATNTTSTFPTRQTNDVPTSPEGVKRCKIEPHPEFYMLQKALGDDVDLMGDDADILLDKLMSQW